MPPSTLDRPAPFFARIEWLTSHRFLLLCLLLAANGLTRPYAGLIHDSRLYAVQINEQVAPGAHSEDLYLLYGSQDRYTIFTPLMAPLVRLAGFEIAFFLAYLVSKALFYWALLRFVFAIVEDRAAALLALFYFAVAGLPFGGNNIFHLNETFLTPRIAASALVLLALEQRLVGRSWPVLLLLAFALLLHPLMAFAGVLVMALWWLAERLTARQLTAVAVAGVLLGAVVIGFEALGTRVFGHMDTEWRDITLARCYTIGPTQWFAGDWLRIGVSVFVVGAALRTFARRRAALLLAVLAAAVLGVIGSLIAVHSHYRLLIQVSPYRTLWLLELLSVPLGFWGAARLWRSGRPLDKCGAAALILLITADWHGDSFPPVLVFLLLQPFWAVFYRARPRRRDWLAGSVTACLLTVTGLLCAYDLAELTILLTSPPNVYRDCQPLQALIDSSAALFKLPLLLLVLSVAVWLRPAGLLRLQEATLLGFWLGYQGMLTGLVARPEYAEGASDWQAHRRFVAEYLRREMLGRPTALTVYWTADLRDLWFGARVNSYYNWVQLSGCAFNRGTAVEGKRRAFLVRAFEMHRIVRNGLPASSRTVYQRFYQAAEDVQPTQLDLFRICGEPGLDFVVLEYSFPGLYSASDGHFYIYDCRRLRQGLRP